MCSLQERKMYEAGCKYIWNIDTNQYKITHILPMTEKSWKKENVELSSTPSPLWNPTRYLVPLLRKKSNQHYARPVRYLEHSMSFSSKFWAFWVILGGMSGFREECCNRFLWGVKFPSKKVSCDFFFKLMVLKIYAIEIPLKIALIIELKIT